MKNNSNLKIDNITEDIDYASIYDSFILEDKPKLGPIFISVDGKFINLGYTNEHSIIFGGEDYESDDYYVLEDLYGLIKANSGSKWETFPYIDIWTIPNSSQKYAIIDWLYFIKEKGVKKIWVNTSDSNEAYDLTTELPEDIYNDIIRDINMFRQESLNEKLNKHTLIDFDIPRNLNAESKKKCMEIHLDLSSAVREFNDIVTELDKYKRPDNYYASTKLGGHYEELTGVEKELVDKWNKLKGTIKSLENDFEAAKKDKKTFDGDSITITTDDVSYLLTDVIDKLSDDELLNRCSINIAETLKSCVGATFIIPSGKIISTEQNGCRTHLDFVVDLFEKVVGNYFSNKEVTFSLSYYIEDYILNWFVNSRNWLKCNDGKSQWENRFYCVIPKNKLTQAQYDTLEEFLQYGETITSDVIVLTYDSTSQVYNFKETFSEDIIKKIKRYYTLGYLEEELKDNVSVEEALTKQQKDYFQNSKVKDYKGNLIPVYHSSYDDFDVFNAGKLMWFALDRGYAKETFGDGKHIYKCYINITKPFMLYKYCDLNNWFFDEDEMDEDVNLCYKDEEARHNAPLTPDAEALMNALGVSKDKFTDLFVKCDYNHFNYMYYLTNSPEFADIIKSKGYDGVFASEGWGNRTFGVLSPNQIKRVDNKTPTSSDNINEAANESSERKLTQQQEEYFKNSKIRDKNGNLIVCYHGARMPGFKEFSPKDAKSQFGKYKFGNANVNYFTTDKRAAISYTNLGIEENGNVYACYLNVVNPFIVNNESLSEIKSSFNIKDSRIRKKQIQEFEDLWYKYGGRYVDEDDLSDINRRLRILNYEIRPSIERTVDAPYEKQEGYYDLYALGSNNMFGAERVVMYSYELDELFDADMYSELKETIIGEDEDDYFLSTDDIVRFVLAMNEEEFTTYDGIIIEDIIDSKDMFAAPGTDIITLKSSNQIKLIDNENPTSSNRIDEELVETDSVGNALSKKQIEFFKNSKVRNNDGKLLMCYHGSKTSDDFDTFKYDSEKQTGHDYGKAFYFTTDLVKAQGYSVDTNKDPRITRYKKEKDELLKKFLNTKSEEDKDAYLNYKLDGKYKLTDLLNDEDFTQNAERLGHTKSVYLNIVNPLIVDAKGEYFYKVYPDYFEIAHKNNNDGIIIKNVIDNPRGEHRPIDVYICFNENQIKSINNKTPTSSDNINEELITGQSGMFDVDVFVTDNAYSAKTKLYSLDVLSRIFIDGDLYLIADAWDITHTGMVSVAQQNGYNTKFNDFKQSQICLICAPIESLLHNDYDEITDITDDDYDTAYDYENFIIYSRYNDFKEFDLYKVLGKPLRIRKLRKSTIREANKEPLTESIVLDEATRNQLIAKSRNADDYAKNNRAKGRNRYERRLRSTISSSKATYNRIDMDSLFKRDILTVGIEVHGETDNYIVTVKFNGVLKELANLVKQNKGKLEYKVISQALARAFNSDDLKVHCSCPDSKYRQSYYQWKNNYGTQVEPRPSKITNPNDTKGAGCKHTLLVLSNLDWALKVASVLNNYIKYCQKNLQVNYATYIFPKIYGMPYNRAVQLNMFDTGLLPSDQKTIEIVATQQDKNRDEKGRWVSGNDFRYVPKKPAVSKNQLTFDLDNNEKEIVPEDEEE